MHKKTAYSFLLGSLFLAIGVWMAITDYANLKAQQRNSPHPFADYFYYMPEAWMRPDPVDLLENKDPAQAEAVVNHQWEKWHDLSVLDYHLVLRRSAPFSSTIHEVTVTFGYDLQSVYQISDCELLVGDSQCRTPQFAEPAYSVDGLFQLLLDLIQSSTEQSCLRVYFDENYAFPAFISYKSDCEQVFDAGVLWYITYFKIPAH